MRLFRMHFRMHSRQMRLSEGVALIRVPLSDRLGPQSVYFVEMQKPYDRRLGFEPPGRVPTRKHNRLKLANDPRTGCLLRRVLQD